MKTFFDGGIIADMIDTNDKIQKLKAYFEKRDDVVMAFLFGSRAEGRAQIDSDWDIGVYFAPVQPLELESDIMIYKGEQEARDGVDKILGAEHDFVVLNRARPALVFDALNDGLELTNKDERMYLELLSKTHYEAVDYWRFVKEFWDIRKQAASLTPKARAFLVEHITFLENEMADIGRFQVLSWQEYNENRSARREVERWVENVVMSLLDIGKTVLASDKRDVPQSYKETLRQFAAGVIPEEAAEQFGKFAELRNLIAHRYLDMRWQQIRQFLKVAEEYVPRVIAHTRALIEKP